MVFWVGFAVIAVIGVVGLAWPKGNAMPTEKEVRDYENELQRKFARRPLGKTGETREKSDQCSCIRCRRVDPSTQL